MSTNKRKVSAVWMNSRSGQIESRMQVQIVDKKNTYLKKQRIIYKNVLNILISCILLIL